MGRHAKGPVHSRVPIATLAVGAIIGAAIGAGSWWNSQTHSDPLGSGRVSGTAVVVSSLACTDAVGGTVVDLLGTTAGNPPRVDLAACGYQEGERLAVTYPAIDPTQLTVTDDGATGDTTTGGTLLPIGLAVAALLALGAALAVWIDSRRARRAAGRRRRRADQSNGTEMLEPLALLALPEWNGEPEWIVESPTVTDAPAVAELGTPGPPARHGRHARAEVPADEQHDPVVDSGWHGPLSVVHVLPSGQAERRATTSWPREFDDSGDVDLVFPYASSLAASLHDELFTHRGVPAGS